MSTGADCRFIEAAPGEWYYELQRWPYGEWPEYDVYGPFLNKDAGHEHLRNNHANPGSYFVEPASVVSDEKRAWLREQSKKTRRYRPVPFETRRRPEVRVRPHRRRA